LQADAILQRLIRQAQAWLSRTASARGAEADLRWISRPLISILDAHWREHLRSMDSLRDGIHLQYVAQKDPLVEYRTEGFLLFEEMLFNVRRDLLQTTLLMGMDLPTAGTLTASPAA
jgi:preprotein translocase subunit SecA